MLVDSVKQQKQTKFGALLQTAADEIRYRLTLAVLTIIGILFVASIAAHYCVEIAREKLKGQNQ